MITRFLLVCAVLFANFTGSAATTVETIAGTGDAGFSGDGGPALKAQLKQPVGFALDSAGNLFIADTNNNRIRRVDAKTQIITTIAGNGKAEFSGDNGKATDAALNMPEGVCVDSKGNVLIADSFNHRIRKVEAVSGNITTVAGDGFGTKEQGRFAGDGGAATAASLWCPTSVAVDSHENIIVADYFNNRIRKIDAKTGIITTVAGNSETKFNGEGKKAVEACLCNPIRITFDGTGNLLIADNCNSRIRKLDFTTETVSTLVGNGLRFDTTSPAAKEEPQPAADNLSALESPIAEPAGVAVDAAGNVYFSEVVFGRIRKVDLDRKITTLITVISNPLDLACDRKGRLFFADASQIKIIQTDAEK